MTHSAKIENGVVTNIIVGTLEGHMPLPDGSPVGIGWVYDGSGFTPPPVEPEPIKPISQRQLRLLLLSILGPTYETHVNEAISAIADDETRAAAEISWEYASEFDPADATLLAVRDALGMSPEDFEVHWQAAQEL